MGQVGRIEGKDGVLPGFIQILNQVMRMTALVKEVFRVNRIRFGMNREGDLVKERPTIEFFQDLYRF